MPGTDYSKKQFQSDLDELTNLINKYSQEGGKERKSKSKNKRKSKSKKVHKKSYNKFGGYGYKSKSKNKSKRRKSHKGGAKGKRILDAEGNPIRSFRVISINGKDISGNKAYALRYYKGTKKNNTPGKAAEHAFVKLCVHQDIENKEACKLRFTLKETTKGSPHKEFGPYQGIYEKLVEPRKIERRDPKTGKVSIYTVRFKPEVSLVGSK